MPPVVRYDPPESSVAVAFRACVAKRVHDTFWLWLPVVLLTHCPLLLTAQCDWPETITHIGGIGGGLGGGLRSIGRPPQSSQSLPSEHIENAAPGPPSSQSPSLAKLQLFPQTAGGRAGGDGGDGGDGSVGGGVDGDGKLGGIGGPAGRPREGTWLMIQSR